MRGLRNAQKRAAFLGLHRHKPMCREGNMLNYGRKRQCRIKKTSCLTNYICMHNKKNPIIDALPCTTTYGIGLQYI